MTSTDDGADDVRSVRARAALQVERAEAQALARQLVDDLAGIAAATAGANTDDEHDPEGATIAFERAQTAAVLDQARRRLTDVDAALARLDDGSWGTCAVCSRTVGDARLDARPTATTCIACASAGTGAR